jgi:hypothetical protein
MGLICSQCDIRSTTAKGREKAAKWMGISQVCLRASRYVFPTGKVQARLFHYLAGVGCNAFPLVGLQLNVRGLCFTLLFIIEDYFLPQRTLLGYRNIPLHGLARPRRYARHAYCAPIRGCFIPPSLSYCGRIKCTRSKCVSAKWYTSILRDGCANSSYSQPVCFLIS